MAENITKISFIEKTKQFFREVKAESSKVSWPQKPQLTAGTVVVIFLIIIFASFLGLVDYIFAFIFKLITR